MTILANETSASIDVMVLDGSVIEIDETVVVTLTAVTEGDADITIGNDDSDTVTIVDDDSATLSIGNATLVEGDSGTAQMVFEVILDKAVDTGLTVTFATADDTAAAGTDCTAGGGTLNFAGSTGEIQTATVDIIGDTTVELDKSFFVNPSNVQASGRDVTIADGQGLGTIANDDTGLSIAATDATKDEGNGGITPFTFTVTRSGVVSGTTTVDYFVDHVHGLA